MVNYRLAFASDYNKINAFYNKMYSANRTLEQFEWEFVKCPFGKSIYVIAENELDEIVGTNCVIPMIVVTQNGEKILTGKSEDTLVDPNYRGQNIFYNIYEFLFLNCREAGIKAIWGFTSAQKPFTKLGFEIPYNHAQSLLVNKVFKSFKYLSTLNINNSKVRSFKIFGLCVLSKFKSLSQLVPKDISTYSMDIESSVNENVEELISRSIGNNQIFHILQTVEFQKWRIYNNPNYSDVRTFSFYNSKKELDGLIIVNVQPNGIVYIVQGSFSNNLESKFKVAFLQKVSKYLFKSGCVLIRNWHFVHNIVNISENDVYVKAGFSFLNLGISFVWKSIEGQNLNPNNFYLSRIASQGTS